MACPDDGVPLVPEPAAAAPPPAIALASLETVVGEQSPAPAPLPPGGGPPVREADLGDTLHTPSAAEQAPGEGLDDTLPEGAMLGSVYRVVRLIGRGGMGAVYEVEHVRMCQRFAAKVLRRELCTPDHIKRLEREAMATSQIEHPSIVRVVNLDETQTGRVFLVAELLEGQDLGEKLTDGALPLEECLTIILQVASALSATHAKGIIHRDLKPQNIFLATKDGEATVKVLDFGIAKSKHALGADKLTAVGTILGTPAYMSPEGVQGQTKLDHRADVYSLGVVLYEMVTGSPPFAEPNRMVLMLRHLKAEVEPPSVRCPGVPQAVDAVLLKALEKAPEARYQTMAELAEALVLLAAELGLEGVVLPEVARSVLTDPGFSMPAFGTVPAPAPAPVPAEVTAPAPAGGRVGWAVAAVALLALGALSYVHFTGRGHGQAPAAEAETRPAPPQPPPAPPPAAGPEVPAAAAAETEPPPPAAEPAPAEVEVTLRSRPKGAKVLLDGKSLGKTPTTVRLPAAGPARDFVFKKRGFKPVTMSLDPAESQSLDATLKRKRRGRPRLKAARDR